MKFPFKIMEQGLEITFERANCLEYYQRSGSMANPDKILTRGCAGKWRWLGKDAHQKDISQRVGVCRRHCANDFDEETLQDWRNSAPVKAHIANIYERQRQKADREAIETELNLARTTHYRPWAGDCVMYDPHSQTYWVRVEKLSREAAIRIYKMADAIRAEMQEE